MNEIEQNWSSLVGIIDLRDYKSQDKSLIDKWCFYVGRIDYAWHPLSYLSGVERIWLSTFFSYQKHVCGFMRTLAKSGYGACQPLFFSCKFLSFLHFPSLCVFFYLLICVGFCWFSRLISVVVKLWFYPLFQYLLFYCFFFSIFFFSLSTSVNCFSFPVFVLGFLILFSFQVIVC